MVSSEMNDDVNFSLVGVVCVVYSNCGFCRIIINQMEDYIFRQLLLYLLFTFMRYFIFGCLRISAIPAILQSLRISAILSSSSKMFPLSNRKMIGVF